MPRHAPVQPATGPVLGNRLWAGISAGLVSAGLIFIQSPTVTHRKVGSGKTANELRNGRYRGPAAMSQEAPNESPLPVSARAGRARVARGGS